jgi:hypothetical protein
MWSDFPHHHRSTSPDRAEVLMVALVTISSVVVYGWIAVWLLSDVGAAWLGAVAGLPVAMLPASIGTVILRRLSSPMRHLASEIVECWPPP